MKQIFWGKRKKEINKIDGIYDEIVGSIFGVVIALATAKGWHLHQMDVKNTFPQGILEEEVYMVQAPGRI